MAGQVLKKRRLMNPGRRRRNMTPKQIKYFGTARQKAGLKNRRRRNVSRRGRRNQGGVVSQAEHAAASAIRSVERAAEDAISTVTGAVNRGGRRKNVGEILTVIPANPGRKRRSMAATRNRRRRVHNRRRLHNRRRHNRARNTHRRRTRNPKVVVRYRNRRRHNRGHRRRNPNFLQGDIGAVVGVLGGAAVTKILAGFLPSSLTAGNPMMSGVGTAVVAVVQGQVVGKVMKNPRLGNWMTIGGLVMAALELASQFFPQLALPLSITGGTSSGTSGMGLLTSSNFYVPQVNVPGSMATFVAPAAIPAPVVVSSGSKMAGLGAAYPRSVRRVGRLR